MCNDKTCIVSGRIVPEDTTTPRARVIHFAVIIAVGIACGILTAFYS